MRPVVVLLITLLLTACSESQVEELVFRKMVGSDLVALCGEKDLACIGAVKEQIKPCMESSEWRSFLNNQDDDAELRRFMTAFYGCIVDADGDPYFEPNIE